MTTLHFDTLLLPTGWTDGVTVDIASDGTISAVRGGTTPPAGAERQAIGLPGLANLHSHAFQRGMAGLAEVAGPSKDSFWTWRQVMYRFLDRLTPEDVEAIAAELYVEMLEAGFTSVGEFHYLHHAPDGGWYDDPAEMAGRIATAALKTGIGLTLLPVFYGQGGLGGKPTEHQQRRFASSADSFGRLVEGARRHLAGLPHARLGIAPHSIRAVTPESLGAVTGAFADGPIHIHAAEQTKEVEDCLAWSGRRPVEWLIEHAGVGPRWCLIHATHMTEAETVALAGSGAVAGLCPITEANLGDGIFPGTAYLGAGGALGVGSDSHVRVDLAEELRLLEYGQRLRDRSRNVFGREGQSSGRLLLEAALAGGAKALQRPSGAIETGAVADIVALDPEHRALVAARGDRIIDGWIFAGDQTAVSAVWVAGRKVVAEGRHVDREPIRARFSRTMRRILA
ncbi:MAG: formimidoylglutamate deiminase [Hyphomicrobiaceae bacterium]